MDWRTRGTPMYMDDLANTQAPLVADELSPVHTPIGAMTPEDAAFVKRDIRKVKSLHNIMNTTGGRKKTMRNASSGGDIVCTMLTIRDQIKLYHWQTGSFARHKATDDLVGALDGHIDTFMETYMGKYGRPKVSGTIKLHNFSEKAARDFVAKQTDYLTRVLPRKLKSSDTDLLNIRDEILGDVNKTLYLFTLQ